MTGKGASNLPRRSLLLAAASGALGACQPFGTDYGTLKTALAVGFGLEDAPRITLEQAAAVPYASVAFQIGSSGEGMLVLASANGQDLLWTSSQRLAITTRNGRIVATAGLQWNLTSTVFAQADPLQTGILNEIPASAIDRLLDFNDVKRYAVRVSGHFERHGDETTTILGSKLDTIRIVENCYCSDLDWRFQNQYWVDRETGFLWRSEQSVHPNLAPISISVLRPPG